MTASYPLSVDLLHSDNSSDWNDFMLAVRQNDVAAMQQLPNRTTAQYHAAFQVAVALDKHNAMEFLLGHVHEGLHAALWVAANNGHIECLNTLLKDPRVQEVIPSSQALSGAIEGGHPECIAVMLKQNYAPDYDYSAAFYMALRHGREEAARAIFERCDVHKVYADFCDSGWGEYDPEMFSRAQEIMDVLISEQSRQQLNDLGLQAPSTSKPPKM